MQGDEEGEFAGSYVLTPNYDFIFINNSTTLFVPNSNETVTGSLPGFIVIDKDNSTKYKWSKSDGKYVNVDNDQDFHSAIPESELPADSKLRLIYNLHKECGKKGSILLDYKEAKENLNLSSFNSYSLEDKAKLVNATISNFSGNPEKSSPIGCEKKDAETDGSKWVEIPLDCNSPDIKDLVTSDVRKIEQLVSENNNSKIVEVVNAVNYKCVFENIESNILIKLIVKLGGDSTIRDGQEKAILRLIKFVKREAIDDLFLKLKENNIYENMIVSFQDKVLLLFGGDNETSLFKLLGNRFSNLTDDEYKWYLINTLISKRYYDIRDNENKKTYITELLSSTNEYHSLQNDLPSACKFFLLMLIDDFAELSNYKEIFDIAILMNKNREAFDYFTQGRRRVIIIPDLIFDDRCVPKDYGFFEDWSWIKPGAYTLNCTTEIEDSRTGEKIKELKFTQEEVNQNFVWAKYLKENSEVNNLYSSNLSQLLTVFKREFNKYISTYSEEMLKFWDTVDISCNSLTSIFNHIVLKESSTMLSSVSKEKRIKLLKTYFKDCGWNFNADTELSYEDSDKAILMLLASFDKDDVSVLNTFEEIGISRVYDKLYFKENFETLAKVLVWIGGQIQSTGHYEELTPEDILNSEKEIKDFSNLLGLESDMLQFKNFSSEINDDNTFTVGSNKYNYNKMVVVYAAGDFEFLGQKFKEGDVLTMPFIQAYAMQKSNRNIVGGKIAWTVVDVVLLAVGYGEIKVLFTAGNYLRKAFVVSELVGTSGGILVNLVNESALSPKARYNLQMLAILASLPQVAISIRKVDELVTMIDGEINALSNLKHKEGLKPYFSTIKSRIFNNNLSFKNFGYADDIVTKLTNKVKDLKLSNSDLDLLFKDIENSEQFKILLNSYPESGLDAWEILKKNGKVICN